MRTKAVTTPAKNKPATSTTRANRAKTAPEETAVENPSLKPKRAGRPSLSKVVETEKKILRPGRATKSAATATRRTTTRAKKIEIPSILLEGDHPEPSPVAGPGEKYSLGPAPVAQKFEAVEAELPEAYGTKKLFLTARDPHWLYAHWDLTREQQKKFNAKSSDGHLVLRVYEENLQGHPVYEIHVHPESRHWFAHVERAGLSYAAELGFYSSLCKWTRVAVSAGTVTPPDAAAAVETDVEFATIPFEFPFAKLMEIIKAAVRDNLPLARAIEELRHAGHPDLPRARTTPPAQWTPQHEQAMAKIVSVDPMRRVWMGSLEITELIRRRLAHEISSLGSSQFGVSSLSSPFGGGGAEKAKGFWFNVNAELIIYGATEPDAKVTLGGHEIKLRPDGSFSYRFALPDGKYDMPAVAVSSDGTDGRAAELKFGRETQYLGDVGAHPQDPSLKPPLPENL
jgi:hypothetical protein